MAIDLCSPIVEGLALVDDGVDLPARAAQREFVAGHVFDVTREHLGEVVSCRVDGRGAVAVGG